MSGTRGRYVQLLVGAAVLVVWFFGFRPAYLGGPVSYVLVSGVSMLPTLEDGDLVLVRERSSYSPGDVVAFHVSTAGSGQDGLVVHRIVGGSARAGYVTEGDNGTGSDPWSTTPADIEGELWIRVPGAARMIGWIRDPIVFGGLVAAFTVFSILASPQGGTHARRARGVVAPTSSWQLTEIRSGRWAFPAPAGRGLN
jgi:signal peptidase